MSRIFLLLVIFAVLSFSEARHKSHHKSKNHHECKHKAINKNFRHFYEDVIEVDKKEENSCKKLEDVLLREYYGTDIYKVMVPMKNATEDHVKIKVHHRALLIDVEDKFSVMRNLPQIVKPKESSYIIDDGHIIISFPYNVEFGKELEVKCDNDIEDESSFVSKSVKEKETNLNEVELFEVTTN